jgi:ATP-dependent helicase HepA
VTDFTPGQRWINNAELQLGLGTVLAIELRTVTLLFSATGETRTYSRQTAPLTRVSFTAGDMIRSHDGRSLKVVSVQEQDGLLTYTGTGEDGRSLQLMEGELDSHVQLHRPAERLFTGQVDRDKWFELRYQTLQHLDRLAHSDLRGLVGARTSLIPHQLYIAHEVANRYAPRVLLADEVGLGKTIEAGLILHQQLLTERAQRVLIVVPETLLHQWLVEMLRRFNLQFSILDEDRCQAIDAGSEMDNPFHTQQLVLCTLEFLVSHPQRHQQALTGDWDLLVVDEVHHLQWTPAEASPEYRLIEQLTQETRGVLLLTATPEQLGKASHFARLRLLDPDRFPDFDAFVEEEQRYEPVARAVSALLSEQALDADTLLILRNIVTEQDIQSCLDTVQNAASGNREKLSARTQLVEHLLDRHGTGRVLFRNTRSAVRGFPDRVMTSYPLPLPEAYASDIKQLHAGDAFDPQLLLSPELLYQSGQEQTRWTGIDPRMDWLRTQLKKLWPEKVLLITASAGTALDIAETLRIKSGIHAAVFHEGMSIMERDRAAAWFADPEFGTQILVCSEIGSEGRNFQFAHHLVLFDLPLNPDLLEQRIGRLDRIGQTQTIKIHVPYLEHSAQALMLHWYHEGLKAFEHTCPAGYSVFVRVNTELLAAIRQGDSDASGFISTTREHRRALNEALHRGRDRLLEYNSCRPHIANVLPERIKAEESAADLMGYLETVFDCYDIEIEPHSESSYIIRPGEHMHTGSFPGLRDDGMTITCDREIALANEDRHFMSWEHPLVTGAMEMVLANELGNTAMTALQYRGAKPGTMLLECMYTLDAVTSDVLQTSRYLPPTTIRIVADPQGKDHGASLAHSFINEKCEPVSADTASKIIRTYTRQLRDMVEVGDAIANRQAPELLARARQQSRQTLKKEINRLKALRRINTNVRSEEIEFMELQLDALAAALDSASFRLEALRVIVVT